MTQASQDIQIEAAPNSISKTLWLYTNYDCNLSYSYCVAESTPKSPRRAICLETKKRLVDEALVLGFEQLYFTGGEPFILEDIYGMLAYASAQLPTTVLTNAMLLRGKRLEKLITIQGNNLIVQVSLDGSSPDQQDPFHGQESWTRTIEGLDNLQANGFKVRLSTTKTSANSAHLDEICAFHLSRGIPEADHIIRPLARRGFSNEGMQVCKANLVPELTINADGVFWHPISTDPDLLVVDRIFPLDAAVRQAAAELADFKNARQGEMEEFQ